MEDSMAKKLLRLKKLHQELANLGPMMRGSVVVIGTGTRKKQPYFSLNKNGKTKLIYLGKKREPLAKAYSDNYRRLMEIVEEMTQINMASLKTTITGKVTRVPVIDNEE
jgi:hypothetical protein